MTSEPSPRTAPDDLFFRDRGPPRVRDGFRARAHSLSNRLARTAW